MSRTNKLTLTEATLISINVMIGFGIFVNTTKLAQIAGFLGFLGYVIVGILILPLIDSIASLMAHYADGGFYEYGAKAIHPFAGFISAWAYFTGKLASASLIIHVVNTLLQQLIPLLNAVPTLALDALVLLVFAYLNTLHMKTGSSVNAGFFILKMLPVIFVILSGLYALSSITIPVGSWKWEGIPLSIPFALYSFTGFEAACSLSRSIENSERNGPRAIYTSFIAAFFINVLYQLFFFATTHGSLMEQTNYMGAYPSLFASLFPNSPTFAQHAVSVVHLFIATSALGSSYGILFSNPWNLFIVAEEGHTFGKKILTTLNTYGMPVACVIAETILCLGYLVLTEHKQTSLTQTSALACTISYTISVIALLFALRKKPHAFKPRTKFVAFLALASCCIFAGSCIRNFFIFGIAPLLGFAGLLLVGIAMYISTATRKKTV